MDILSISITRLSNNGYLINHCTDGAQSIDIQCEFTNLTSELLSLKNKFAHYVWLVEESQSFLVLMNELSVSFIDIALIDLKTETNMVMLTHPDFKLMESSLDSFYYRYKLQHEVSPSIKQLKAFKRVFKLLSAIKNEAELKQQMANRGEYIKAMVKLTQQGAGFPIDEGKLHSLFDNKAKAIDSIQQQVNEQYGDLFIGGYGNKQLSHKQLRQLAKLYNINWQTWHSSDLLRLDTGYIKHLTKQHSELKVFYQSLIATQAINSADLSKLNQDGFIKPSLHLMTQKTGRNTHKPSEGYLLNAGQLIKSLIKPKPNHCLIEVDWCQQEIGIAAALSGDKALMDIYNTPDGDVYMALAKQAEFAPVDATKQTHPDIRQLFKTMQIGLAYGRTIWSLAKDIKASTSLTLSEAYHKAQQIHDWHKQTFHVYWKWVADEVNKARALGYMQSLDGWTYFVDDNVKDTQLLNFPMQANGAALMRLAIRELAKHDDIDFICTQHDAIYVNAPTNDRELVIQRVQNCMAKACVDLFNGKLLLRTELKML